MVFALILLALATSRTALASESDQSVEVGAFLNDISNVDVTTGQATFDLYLWVVSPEKFDVNKEFEIVNDTGTT